MYVPPHPDPFSFSSYTAAEQRSFGAYSNWIPSLTRPPPPQPDPYYQSNILPTAPPMFNQGFRDGTGFYRCETNRQGNGQWKKLMMEMKGLQEKKVRLEEQHLQGGRSEGMSLQERRLQEEETLLGRRYREEKDRIGSFEGQDYGELSEGWMNEQRKETSDWRAEKKLRLEEARELDRMWDIVKRKGKYEGSVSEMRRRNWPKSESERGSDLKKAEQEEFGSRRALDLSEEIAEKERELRRREEKLRREERKLDEMSRAEKERSLKEREERLRRKEKELYEKSGRSATCYDNWGSREWSRSSDRSSSSKCDKRRDSKKLNYDHEERSRKLKEDEELTLEISIPNQPEDSSLRRQDDMGHRELSSFSNRSVSSKGESGGGSRNIRRVNYDHTILKMERLLREKQERVCAQLARERKNRERSRNRSRKGMDRTIKSSQNTESPLKLPSGTSSEDEALPRAPVKSRLGVRRGVKERLGRRSKIAKQEMERDLSMVQFEGRVVAELQVHIRS